MEFDTQLKSSSSPAIFKSCENRRNETKTSDLATIKYEHAQAHDIYIFIKLY